MAEGTEISADDPRLLDLQDATQSYMQNMDDEIASRRAALADLRSATQGGQAPAAPVNPYIAQGEKDLDAYRQAIARESQARKEGAAAMRPEYQKAIDALEADRLNPIARPAVPTLPKAPQRQATIDQGVAKSLFAVASMMAGLSMLGGRGRGMLAMAGMTGALQGFNEGNYIKYKTGMDEYKANVDAQIQEYNMARTDYLDQVRERHGNLESMFRELELKGRMNGDQTMVAAAESKDLGEVLKHTETLGKMTAQMAHATGTGLSKLNPTELRIAAAFRAQGSTTGIPTIDQLSPANAAIIAGIAPKPTAAGIKSGEIFGIPMDKIPTVEPGQKNEQFLSMLPPATAQLVRSFASGKMPVSGFGGLDVTTRSELSKAAQIYDPAGSAAQNFLTKLNLHQEYANPGKMTGANILAINTMTHHINDFGEAFAKLNNQQVQRWNSAKNKLSQEFGDPALNAVQASALLVQSEYAKVAKGGRAAPTDQEMTEWRNIFTTNMSPSQMRTTVWQALQGAGGRLAAMEEAYKKEMGENFGTIYPESREIIDKWKPKGIKEPTWLKEGSQPGTPSTDRPPNVPQGAKILPGYIVATDNKTGKKVMVRENYYNLHAREFTRLEPGQEVKAPQVGGLGDY